MCIARRFNAGNHSKRESSPEATAEDRCGTTVQPSLRDLARPTMILALKRVWLKVELRAQASQGATVEENKRKIT
jgi:hypothetical protein